ncbi:MAG: hypothetical protein IPJ13_17805 [Saprospiraceae bacterium]|nr:hypothetical protein [Saprospiraceae bacterium]
MGESDGGDGGGGHIILKGNSNVWTLLALKYQKHVIATPGVNGSETIVQALMEKTSSWKCTLGTVARDFGNRYDELRKITKMKPKYLHVACRRGMETLNFKSSTRQTPDYHSTRRIRNKVWKVLELKVLADVGLVGFPNAGKSSLFKQPVLLQNLK